MKINKKYILFGAGLYGKMALEEYGKENVAYFTDNNKKLIGKKICGISVIDLSALKEIYQDYEIVISVKNSHLIEKQIQDMGIYEYSVYGKMESYFPTSQLIVNPYSNDMNETYVNNSQDEIVQKIKDLDEMLGELDSQKVELFNHIEIETINRCNGVCSFCPVNVRNDSRTLALMPWNLFEKIIGCQTANYNRA